MSEPRISMLPIDEAKQVAAKMDVPEAIAELSVFRILLRQPKLAKRINDLLMTLLIGGDLDARLRELIIMRIGWATGSVYEWTQHWRVALQLGVPESDVLAVRDWREHSNWSDVDRAILQATDETLEDGAVSPETWAECAKHLPTETEQLELLGAIGTWRMISQILRSLEVPLEDGVAAWPPDGLAPDGVANAASEGA